MENTSFTIIMPVYNTKKEYLEFAVNSVFNLDYDNFELLIIDDGSDEETKQILKQYKNRTTILTQNNTGMCKARINAFPYIRNDYVIFMDSDDYIEPDSLKILNKIILENNCDMILYDFARFKCFDIDNYFSKQKFFTEGFKNKKEVLEQLCSLHLNSICSKIIKKELLDGLEQNINLEIRNGDDLQQSTYLILKASTFYYTESIIQLYRILDEQRSYYNIHNIIRDINWLVRPLHMLKENNTDKKLLNTFYTAAVNNIVFNGFRICILAKDKEERNTLLNELLLSKIVKEISRETIQLPLHLSILFGFLVSKNFSLFATAAFVYDRLAGIQRI